MLLHTGVKTDLSYIMWEGGVATDPNPDTEDTRVILFTCTDHPPTPVAENAYVDMRNSSDICRGRSGSSRNS